MIPSVLFSALTLISGIAYTSALPTDSTISTFDYSLADAELGLVKRWDESIVRPQTPAQMQEMIHAPRELWWATPYCKNEHEEAASWCQRLVCFDVGFCKMEMKGEKPKYDPKWKVIGVTDLRPYKGFPPPGGKYTDPEHHHDLDGW